jgi:hypothetical protein
MSAASRWQGGALNGHQGQDDIHGGMMMNDLNNGNAPAFNNIQKPNNGLPYRLSEHRKNWTIWFGLFCFDGCLLPIILFYALWFGSSLSHWTSMLIHHLLHLVTLFSPHHVFTSESSRRLLVLLQVLSLASIIVLQG